ncbi:MAG: hypothetical protein AAGE65_01770 [Planctomycetota bacterium]
MCKPYPCQHLLQRRANCRESGSVLVLAVVLIVLLVMMGASFLQMARSDRRSTQLMDTRAQDYDDNELAWFNRSLLVPDLPIKTPTRTEDENGAPLPDIQYGQIGRDYPFTWSANPEIQGGSLLTFPVDEAAAGPVAALDDPDANGGRRVDPRDPSGSSTLYRAQGIGPARTAFIGEIADAFDEAGLPTFNPAVTDRGQNDDMWLASNEPVFEAWPSTNPGNLPDSNYNNPPYPIPGGANGNATGYWPHISNMRGVFLDLGNHVTLAGGGTVPRAYLSTADNNLNSGDTWLDLTDMQREMTENSDSGSNGNWRFADADGDGIADSRWTYAAATSGGGLTYVAAWRVIDNSAMVNLNVASASDPSSLTIASRPRWYNPTDLSPAGSFLPTGLLPYTANPVAQNAGDNLLTLRGLNVTPNGINANGYIQRLTSWLLTGKPYRNAGNTLPNQTRWDRIGNGLQQLADTNPDDYPTAGSPLTAAELFRNDADDVAPSIGTLGNGRANEIELRFRNGLNRNLRNLRTYADAPVESTTDLRFWRANVDADRVESTFTILYSTTGFPGGPIQPTIDEFFQQESRKRFTTINGSGDFGRFNLNEADRNDIRDFFRALGDEIDDLSNSVFTKNRFDLLDPARANIVGPDPSGASGDVPTWDGFARMAAAFAIDWRDDDIEGGQALPELTASGVPGGAVDSTTYYGMEYLPFISEVYLKARYDSRTILQNVFVDDDGDSNTPDVNGDRVTFELLSESDYYVVIELVNPWNVPIPLAEIELTLENGSNTRSFGTQPDDLRDRIITALSAGTAGSDRNYLYPNEIVYLHVGDFTGANELDELESPVLPPDGSTGSGSADVDAVRVDIGPIAPNWFSNGSGDWDIDAGIFLALNAPIEGTTDTAVYQRFAVPALPDTVVQEYARPAVGFAEPADPSISTHNQTVARISIVGTAAGLSMLTVNEDDVRMKDNFDETDSFLDELAPPAAPIQNDQIPAVIERLVTPVPLNGTPGSPDTGHWLGTYDKGQTSGDPAFPGFLDTRVDDALRITGDATGFENDLTATNPTSPDRSLPSGTTPVEPFLIGNADHFVRASDFFRIVFLGPRVDRFSNTLTVADVWKDVANNAPSAENSATTGAGGVTANTNDFQIRDFMIDAVPQLAAGSTAIEHDFIAYLGNAPSVLQQTFPGFLFSKLSTFAPGSDGIDNDGDGRIDDADEQLVPGRMNLNTISIDPNATGLEDTLRRVLPMDNAADRNAVAETIRRMREFDPAIGDPVMPVSGVSTVDRRRASGRTIERDGPGLLSIYDLLDAVVDADLGLPAAAERITGDFNEYEANLTANNATDITFDADDTRNDAEERLAALGALNQVFDVRSDVYTVYILLRGYPTGDFASGAQREFRITATVDRSVVHEGRAVPRIVSYNREDLLLNAGP